AGVLELEAEAIDEVPAPAVRLVLVQALAKGGRDELAVETATELGVDEVVPWQAERSVVVWTGDRGRRAHGKWLATVRAAAKQSRRARLPDVAEALTTAELARRVRECTVAGGLVLALDGDAPTTLAGLRLPARATEVLVVVGPEGGIAPSELAGLIAAGAVAVRLGPHVLRTSSAGAAALAVLSVRIGRWG
ncbi:MAG: 16S rRNA (uracil(1498)-N(3))-methyltransferase, partial [Kineosporiaceae bacterium]